MSMPVGLPAITAASSRPVVGPQPKPMWLWPKASQVFAIFVITVAAAEVGIGLSIVLMIFRNRKSANVDELDLMRW